MTLNKKKQQNTTQHNILYNMTQLGFFKETVAALGGDSLPQSSVYDAAALPTELSCMR